MKINSEVEIRAKLYFMVVHRFLVTVYILVWEDGITGQCT